MSNSLTKFRNELSYTVFASYLTIPRTSFVYENFNSMCLADCKRCFIGVFLSIKFMPISILRAVQTSCPSGVPPHPPPATSRAKAMCETIGTKQNQRTRSCDGFSQRQGTKDRQGVKIVKLPKKTERKKWVYISVTLCVGDF